MIALRILTAYHPDSNTGPPPGIAERLSRQQTQVALLVADGYSDKQIADMLHVSRNAVRIYIDRIRKTLELRKDRNVRTEITRVVVEAWAEYEDCLTNSQQVGAHE